MAIVKAVKVKLTAGRIADFECPKGKSRTYLWCDEVKGLTDKISNGVKWVTLAGKENSYDIGACQKTLETWNKSRA